MAITHATNTGPIGETQWLEDHTVDAAALRAALNVADGATANSGTVTSVGISGSDGIDVDSGSPITTSGAIALGINAATLRAHINVEDGATADQAAAEVPVSATPANYTAATSDVEAHLAGLDTALGGLGGGHDAVTVTDTASVNLTLTGQALTAAVIPGGVDHDSLSGYVANEHIDWTADQGATNLHAGNIPDLSATYEAAGAVSTHESAYNHATFITSASVTYETLSANGDVGTSASQVAAGDHNHSGIYEPADATILKDADIGTTVQSYDADTAKLDTAQTWTAAQAFGTVTGSAVTVTSPGAAQSVALDGRIHVIELADATETTITGTPTGTGYSSAIVRIKGSAAGTGTIAWPAGHIAMNDQSLNAAAGAYTDFMLDSHDGSTVLYRGVGVEP